MPLLDNPVRKIVSAQKDVTTAGTQVQLTSPTQSTVAWVIISAKAANTGDIYVGDADVSSTNGIVLVATSHPLLLPCDPSGIWIDSETNGEGVGFVYGIV